MHATNEAFFHETVLVVAELDDRYVTPFDETALPNDWRSFPPAPSTQRIGDRWLASASGVGLRVPSAVIPREHNVLVNPQHRDFAKCKVVAIEAWGLDPRLLEPR